MESISGLLQSHLLENTQLFSPDPLHVALESLCADELFRLFSSPSYLKLPITVRHHIPPTRAAVATLSLADALDAIFQTPTGGPASRSPGARTCASAMADY